MLTPTADATSAAKAHMLPQNETKIFIDSAKPFTTAALRRSSTPFTTVGKVKKVLRNRFEILNWIVDYNTEWALSDLIAGITLGLTIIPESIACALLAGLPARYGLCSAFLGCFVYLIFGSIPKVIVGPTSLVALVSLQFTVGKPIEFAILLTFLTGVVELIMGVLRVGVIFEFLSVPVIKAFSSATAILVIESQIKVMLGVKYLVSGFIGSVSTLVQRLHEANTADLIMGTSAVIFLLTLEKMEKLATSPKMNPTLACTIKYFSFSRNALIVLLTGFISYMWVHENQSVPYALSAKTQAGLPNFTIPNFSAVDAEKSYTFIDILSELNVAIIVIPVIGILTNISIGKLSKYLATYDYEFSRAAMICVFHLKIVSACDILSKAADLSRNSKDPHDASVFRIAAIALSSFNADRGNSTWRNQRSNANKQIQDAHLRAIFSFLTTENDNFDAVLTEDGISLADRVAFACKYLSETKLSDYVKELIQKSIENGDLNGLLLTGESLDGINILQAYLDLTSDVQTVALIAINYFHREHFTDNRIQYWISSYLDDLNSWGLWEKRAELDIKIENLRTGTRTTRSVFLSCNFCGKSVSNALQEDARMRSASSNVNKLSSCPSCRKPLPRCSLCLLHMGTTLNISLPSDATHESLGWQSKPFSKWFSWCQTCRHGGHTEHMMQWFKQNSECPVSSCSCRCFDMDGTIPNDIPDCS
ncbi:GATOR2 complex protein MIOS-like [Eurosta solidaginis]|uniref:GATOR2 complex protein MIOS-like n=1 Tax=Eurosta solidaginis TaxID=178769 RepID=UPI00353168F1